MMSRIILFLSICCVLQNQMQAGNETFNQDSITVYVFLHESCLISQYYTLPLRELSKEFTHEQLQFVGIFPNRSSSAEKIAAFQEKYQIPFELITDYDRSKTSPLGATITPEVVVVNESHNEILYKGRIDDTYVRVGRRKRITTTSELKDALTAISNCLPVAVAQTEAIGCFISKR